MISAWTGGGAREAREGTEVTKRICVVLWRPHHSVPASALVLHRSPGFPLALMFAHVVIPTVGIVFQYESRLT